MITNSKGKIFISYRRLNQRVEEAVLIRNALRDRGIPTWRDLDDLESKPTEDELARVLSDEDTAGAILLIVPEVADSTMIRNVEAPRIFNRRHDGTFIIKPVLIGLEYDQAEEALSHPAGFQDLGRWNLHKTEGITLTSEDARVIANDVLRARLSMQADQFKDSPLDIRINTRDAPDPSFYSLNHDFSSYFEGRYNNPDAYLKIELALKDTAHAIVSTHGAATISAAGFASLAVGVLFGAIFSPLRRFNLNWSQTMAGGATEQWSKSVTRLDIPLTIHSSMEEPGSDDVVLALGISANIEPSVTEFVREKRINPRALINLQLSGGPLELGKVLSASEGLDIAMKAIDAVRNLKNERMMKKVNLHLFLACPLGLAVLVGQHLNTVSECIIYEHTPTEKLVYRHVHAFKPSDL